MTRESLILAYHSLDDTGSVVSTRPEKFRQQMRSLSDSGIPVVAMDRVTQSPGSVAITFDDGYSSVLEHGAPILARYGFSATTFVVTGQCGKNNDWDQRGRRIPKLPLMSWSQVREFLSAGLSVGSHSHTHARLNAQNVREELERSKREMEDHLGVRPASVCYPYGEADAAVRRTAGEFFDWACCTDLAYVRPDADRCWLPRIDAYYAPANLATLLTPAGRFYLAARGILRGVNRWLPR